MKAAEWKLFSGPCRPVNTKIDRPRLPPPFAAINLAECRVRFLQSVRLYGIRHLTLSIKLEFGGGEITALIESNSNASSLAPTEQQPASTMRWLFLRNCKPNAILIPLELANNPFQMRFYGNESQERVTEYLWSESDSAREKNFCTSGTRHRFNASAIRASISSVR